MSDNTPQQPPLNQPHTHGNTPYEDAIYYEQMNDQHAGRAELVMEKYQGLNPSGTLDFLVAELLCDLMHWSNRNKSTFGESLDRAYDYYEGETPFGEV